MTETQCARFDFTVPQFHKDGFEFTDSIIHHDVIAIPKECCDVTLCMKIPRISDVSLIVFLPHVPLLPFLMRQSPAERLLLIRGAAP